MQRQQLLEAFTSHFLGEADAAVQEYVTGVLADAADDGSTADETSSSIEGFRTPSIAAPAWDAAVAELLCSLHDPGAHPLPSWAGTAGTAAASSGAPGDTIPTAPQGRHPSGTAIPAPTTLSTLSVHAAAFQPSSGASAAWARQAEATAAALPGALGGLTLSERAVADSKCDPQPWDAGEEDAGWDGYEEEDAGWGDPASEAWDTYDPQWPQEQPSSSPSHHHSYSHSPSQLVAAPYASGPGPTTTTSPYPQHPLCHLQAGSLELSAFLSVLSQQFPEYSPASLQQLLDQQGGSLDATVEALCSLENELQGLAAVGAWTPEQAEQQEEAGGPAFGDADFPSLAPAAAASPHAVQPLLGGTSAGYAAALKASHGACAAAQPPCWPPASPAGPPANRGSRSTASPAAAKAPIWQAQGVQKFATGSAAAAEYAAAREVARDHARLRNMYFQQATQAYLAGQRALAKELGEKGRWHGQQMKVAHSTAAAQIFTQRNSSPHGTGGGSSSRGQDGAATVDLHGLHVSEALERLEGVLLGAMHSGARDGPGASSRKRGSLGSSGGGRAGAGVRLRVVVGVGQHGKVPARLPTAVRRYLQDQGLEVSEPYAGMLEVSLP